MAKKCEICGKGTQKGHKVSHAHNITIKVWKPNLQRVRVDDGKGNSKRIWSCTACIQKGKLNKRVA